ncbi:MAG: ATP-dependent protease ATPase subunit HslU [Acidobacteriota bacterium]
MVIHLPESLEGKGTIPSSAIDDLTPRQIVAELDKYIVGQAAAKRAVAIAIRNRQRRLRLSEDLAEEVVPKNIIMIGPTGVGKTEISRRLSRLTGSPFLKVEATKFTEVGYVGRDVESMVRDLVEISINLVRQEQMEAVAPRAREQAEERLLDLLLPAQRQPPAVDGAEVSPSRAEQRSTREKLRAQLRQGLLDERSVEVEVRENRFPSFQIFSGQGVEQMDINLQNMMPGLFGAQTGRRAMKVPEAFEHLEHEAAVGLLDDQLVTREAIKRVETSGIIFLDEIDKIAGRQSGAGPDVSREGVQRDILPIVEGTVVNTRYGMVRSDHILFLAAGAFHVSKPSDLIPELQGRFPIRVELDPLDKDDLVRILTEPQNSLVRQYTALLHTEGLEVQFSDDAVTTIAEYAALVNDRSENIGARRLHTIMEKVVEELSFTAPERAGERVAVDEAYVRDALQDLVADEDLSKYIL